MRAEVQRDLSKSASDFLNVVWPKIGKWFGAGKLVPVESVTDSQFASTLDMCAGIDAWHIIDGVGIRGIASRVQWGNCYNTFTIRKSRTNGAETEYTKRLRAIKNTNDGWLYPHFTIQSYLDYEGGTLLYSCATKTADLFRCLEEGKYGDDYYDEENRWDGNTFSVVRVSKLKKFGDVLEYKYDDDIVPLF